MKCIRSSVRREHKAKFNVIDEVETPLSAGRRSPAKSDGRNSRWKGSAIAAAHSLALLALAQISAPSAFAATYYWDNNGTTTLFGTAAGTWAAPTTGSATQGWSTDSTGATLPTASVTVATSDAENFGTATANSLLAGTITVSGTVAAGNITFGSGAGAIVLSGGTIGMGASSIIVNNASDTINSVLSGTNALTKAGTGTLILTGVNTRTGALTNSAGTLQFGGASSMGTSGVFAGTIALTAGTLQYSSSAAQTFSGIISGAGAITKDTSTTSTLTLSAVNTYTGATTVSAGTLSLTGNRTAVMGGTVDVLGAGSILNISGDLPMGAQQLRVGSGTTTTGTINQTAGAVTFTSGNELTVGTTTTSQGIYNLSGGTFTTASQANRGILIGTNASTNGAFNLSGTGVLNVVSGSSLQIGRSETGVAASSANGTFSQTGGSATIADLRMGGNDATNNATQVATLNLSGGTFSASSFTALSGGNGSASTINISGTADVTLPAFPTTRGNGTSTATITFNGGTLRPFAASTAYMGGLTNAFIKSGGARFDTTNGSITITQALLTDAVSTGGGLIKQGSNVLTLAGTNTYTGTTTVNAGTLALDYGTLNTSKLSDTTALVLGGGTVDLKGGTHTEIVASTTLTAGTNSSVTSSTPGSVLQMNTITNGAGATVNFGASNIATTDNLNNASGILGYWATVGGTNWAVNSTNTSDGLITAFTGYVDVQRLTPGTIADGPTTFVRLVEGSGSAGSITLGAAVTTINSLNQSATGGGSAATIDPAGQTLATSGILVGTGAGALTIGTGTNNGTVTAGTAGGDLTLTNNTANGLTINSVIADNTSASTLTVSGIGTTTLTGANTYTGATTIGSGTLQIGTGGTSGSIAGTSGVTNFGALVYNRSDAHSAGYAISGTGSLTQLGTGTLTLTNTNTYTGPTIISAGALQIGNGGTTGSIANTSGVTNNAAIIYNRSDALSIGYAMSGTGTLTQAGTGTLTLTVANTHSGGTSISLGGTIATSVAGALGSGNVTNNGTLNLTGGALTYTGLSNITPGALGGNGVVNVTLGTGSGTTALNGDYSTFSGTWNVGIGAAAGAGKVQMNGADKVGATVNILTNATLFTNGATVVHNAGIVLGGGDTGESIGQLRVEGGATWAGPVTLAGTITGTNDGFLGGNTAGGIGTISGNIGETGGPRALSKVGAGTIILTGTNTYTGPTTISAGVLVAQGSVGAALPVTSAVSLGAAATLQVLNNAAGTIAQSNDITLSAAGTSTIAVGNAGGATTGSTVAFGALNNGTTANALASTITFTGASGYLQTYTSLGLTGLTGGNTTLNPTTTSITILGNVTNQESGTLTAHFDTLTLGGTSAGNEIKGIISDAAGGPTVGNGDTRITVNNTGTGGSWTLSGANTYIGVTTLTAGILSITNGNALGSITSGTTQSGTSELRLSGGITVGAEALSISGGGISNAGALRNFSGDNTYGGTITLAAQSRINSDSGTLTLSNATAITGPAQNLVIGGTGNITISGAITTTTGFVSRDGTGTLTLAGANTYTGVTSASAGTISLTGSIASSNISTSGTGVFSQSGTGSIAGSGTFVQGSSGTSTLAGTNTFSGATTVNAGTLVLNYSTQNTSKLSDTAALVLGGGTLDLKGGTHTEIVASTTLTANTASNVTSSVPGSILQMGTITRNAGATINFGASNIATTDTLNTNGIIGTWATVGGVDFAVNSTNAPGGLITAPVYVDVPRLTPGTISDGSATNVRLIEGSGSAGSITLGAATTTINSLNQSATGGNSAATIDPAGQTLAISAILIGTGAGALTIGAGVNNGTVTAATAGGDLALANYTANSLVINSIITNNTSASTLTKLGTGPAILTAANTYSGATIIGGGTLTIAGAGQLGAGTYAGAISIAAGSTLGYSSSADQTLSGAISGAGGLVKDTSPSNLSLSAGNTYTGNTTVNAGTLTLAGATGVGTTGGYLYNGLTSTATVTVASGAQIVISSNNPTVHNALGLGASQTWVVSGTINSTGGDANTLPGTVTLNNGTLIGVSNATFGTFLANSANGYTVNITANGNSNTISSANFGMSGAVVFATPLATDALSVSSILGVTGQLTGALTKTGLGTATLSGANIYTGTTTVTAGTLKVTGSINMTTATNDIIVANTASGNAVLNIQGNVTSHYLYAGSITGAAGAVYMSSGTYTGGADNELGFTFGAGTATGGYGYFGITGGTVNTNRFQFGGQNIAAQNGVGVGLISGGTVNAGSYVILARYGTTPGTIGTLTVATGGTLNHTSATAGQNLALGWQGAGRAELNLTGGTITSATGRVLAYGGGGAAWTGTGIVNLNAGTLTTTAVTTGGTGATSYLNFNGGTLKAVSAQAAFLPALTGVYVNGAFGTYNGGAVVDTNGVAITISAPLIAPTGNGVTTIPVANGGSGYIGAPAVSITDGGTGFGATAIANMIDDGTGNGTFKVGSITITNPGNNYTAPAAALVGGGNGVTQATFGTLSSAANTSGGLSKIGSGDLSLSGTNTYTGTTLVSNGRIIAASAANLSSGASTLTQSGTGQYYLTGATTYTNPFNISSTGYLEPGDSQSSVDGAIRMKDGVGSTILTGTITLSGNSRIGAYSSGGTHTISGQITGGFGIDFFGLNDATGNTHTFTISNPANNYTGNTSISNGNYNSAVFSGSTTTLRLGASNVIPDGATAGNVAFAINGTNPSASTVLDLNGFNETINGLVVGAGSGARITNSATGASVLTVGANDTTSTFSGVISDSGVGKTLALAKTGTGTLTLSGASTFIGDIAINNGTLVAAATASGSNTALGSASNTRTVTVAAGATLRFDNANVLSGNFASTSVPSISISGTVTNNVVGNNALGNVTLNNGTLTATNGHVDYGAFNINGTITSSGTSLISSSGAKMMLTSSGANNVATSSTVNVTSGTLTISAPLAEVTIETKISGLTKTGPGALVLSGAGTYTGPTAVSTGTLQIAPTGSLATTPVTIATGAEFNVLGTHGGTTTVSSPAGKLSGTGTLTGATTISGTVAPGSTSTVGVAGKLTTGAETWAGGGLGVSGTYAIDITVADPGLSTPGVGWDLIEGGASPLTVDITNGKFNLLIQPSVAVNPSVSFLVAHFGSLTGAVDQAAALATLNTGGDGNGNFVLPEAGNANIWQLSAASDGGSGINIFVTSPTPEPGSLSLLGVGVMGLLRRRRRRSAK